MKKLIFVLTLIVSCFTLVACTSKESNPEEIDLTLLETVVSNLNDERNYLIQTISNDCCQYTGAVDGNKIRNEKTHYAYNDDNTVDYTTFTCYYYNIIGDNEYNSYQSNTTNSKDDDYKTTSTWTQTDNVSGTPSYYLSFDLCACCAEKTANKEEYVFTFSSDEENEINAAYSTITVDLTKGIDNVSVLVVMKNKTTTYKITNFNTVELTLPCSECI